MANTSGLSDFGTLALHPPLVVDNGVCSIGKVGITGNDSHGYAAQVDISKASGRVALYQANVTSSDASNITGYRGADIRVTDTASTAAEIAGLQTVVTKSGGDGQAGGHSLWGVNALPTLSGGKSSNIYGVYGEADVTGTATVGGGGASVSFACGLQGYVQVQSTATKDTTLVEAGVVGVAGQPTGAAKADAGVYSILEGRTNQATTGVGALFKGGNFNNQVNPDYGLDFDTTLNSVALAFGKADIRLSTSVTISTGSGAPSASLPKGSLYLRTDGSSTSSRLYVATDGTGTWTPITTAA